MEQKTTEIYTCKFCSKQCKGKQGLSQHENHCVNNPNRTPYKRDCTEVSLQCKFCGKQCKNSNSLINHERLCKLNPDRQLTTYEKFGPIEGFNKKGTHAPCWSEGLTKETSDKVAAMSNKIKKFYQTHPGNFTGRKHSDETKAKIGAKTSISNLQKFDRPSGKGKRGYYRGIYCQSSWELAYVLFCIDNKVNFVRNKKYFNYVYDGKTRHYFPDFYLPDTDTYVEIKGFFDELSKAKAQQFEGNLEVITEDKMQPILNYVETTYGRDFVKMYDQI